MKKLFNNKYLLIGSGLVLLSLLVIGITYAIVVWRTTNYGITLSTACFDVEGDNTLTIQGSNMLLFDEDDILDTTNNTITYKNGMIYAPFKITRGNCSTSTNYEIIINVTSLSDDYANGAIKYKIISDMSTDYTQVQYTNPLNEDLEYNAEYSGSITSTGSHSIYYRSIAINTTEVPAIVFYVDGDLVPESASNLTFNATVEVVATQGTGADYIRRLYNIADKTTATVNGITYNLAPSVGLMNDRLASMDTSIDGGNIRYYGADPNNYVWLGDTFTTDYTYTSNGSSLTRTAGSKKLWRIIGVFDGRLKLIAADPISTQGLSWDTSANAAGGNKGRGINQWGPSGSYEGADLMRLLNPGYTGTNGSLYWNKSVGTVYTGSDNATTANVSFANTGLSQSEKDKIDTAVWYLGSYYRETASYVDVQYLAERQSNTLGKECSPGGAFDYCDDDVKRTSTWNGKVGLMYPSDYGYATDFATCSSTLNSYSNSSNSYACRVNNWLYNSSNYQYTISPCASSTTYATYVYFTASNGMVNYGSSYAVSDQIRPSFYLKYTVNISGGNGTESNPYVLQ